jgi:hypothetical protein
MYTSLRTLAPIYLFPDSQYFPDAMTWLALHVSVRACLLGSRCIALVQQVTTWTSLHGAWAVRILFISY